MDEEIQITRADVQIKIQELVRTIRTQEEAKKEVDLWLKSIGCLDFDRKQILNDLTGYKEYNELDK